MRFFPIVFSLLVLALSSVSAAGNGIRNGQGAWVGGRGLIRGPNNIWYPYGPAYYPPTYFFDQASGGWYVFNSNSRQWDWYPN
jgi:hypothetical protein